MRKKRLELAASADCLDALMAELDGCLTDTECPPDTDAALHICAEEIFVNIASYAYQGSTGQVTVELNADCGRMGITFWDSGVAFNPLEQEKPDLSLPLQERRPGGLGVFFVRAMMDRVEYRRDGEFNCLYMEKKWNVQGD